MTQYLLSIKKFILNNLSKFSIFKKLNDNNNNKTRHLQSLHNFTGKEGYIIRKKKKIERI